MTRVVFWPVAALGAVLLTLLAASPGRADPAAEPALIADVVVANHILFDQGVVDGFGHISVRSEVDPSHYYLARSMAPALVTAADIIEYDLDSNPLNANGRASYLERFIHGQIYKARPDVKAIVHSHSPAVIPFGVSEVPLKPIYHMSSFLGAGVPVFDIRHAAGDTDMLIRDNKLGEDLAKTLGDKPVSLMRGHGSVTVGNSIKQVVFRAVYTEINAKLESDALKLGPVIFLNDEEARLAAKTTAGLVDRPWEMWKLKVEKQSHE
jgi:ribulose-5-phosphate 4-epimerase/fuculose-1-phosphate aldolase